MCIDRYIYIYSSTPLYGIAPTRGLAKLLHAKET